MRGTTDDINELVQANKWLGDEFIKSNYFRDYLDKLVIDLKESTKF